MEDLVNNAPPRDSSHADRKTSFIFDKLGVEDEARLGGHSGLLDVASHPPELGCCRGPLLATFSWRRCFAGTPAPREKERDFPGGAVVKNPPANSGDTGSSPGPGRSHMPRSN